MSERRSDEITHEMNGFHAALYEVRRFKAWAHVVGAPEETYQTLSRLCDHLYRCADQLDSGGPIEHEDSRDLREEAEHAV